jgi:hypothetical protein
MMGVMGTVGMRFWRLFRSFALVIVVVEGFVAQIYLHPTTFPKLLLQPFITFSPTTTHSFYVLQSLSESFRSRFEALRYVISSNFTSAESSRLESCRPHPQHHRDHSSPCTTLHKMTRECNHSFEAQILIAGG